MEKIRIGIIGTGGIAHSHMNEGYQSIGDTVEVVAVCDINHQKAKDYANLYGIGEDHAYGCMEDMISNESLDAVDVCVWNVNHAKCSIYAMKQGLHVFCEKPMAYNAQEAEEMKRVSEETGKILTIGFVTRFADDVLVAKDYIDNGYLGDIYYARANYVRRLGNPGSWFSDKSRSGGGPVIDLGVHVIDRARYLMGRPMPVSVYAVSFNKLGNRKELKNTFTWKPLEARDDEICDVEDFASAIIRFDNGAAIQLEASFSINDRDNASVTLCGTKAGIRFDGDSLTLITDVNGYLADVKVGLGNIKNKGNEFARELKYFVNSVLGKDTPKVDSEDGVICMKIVDAIYESARTGHEVIIK